MNHRPTTASPLLSLTLASTLACSEAEPDRRQEVLAGLVDAQLSPDLDDARARADALAAAVASLCAAPEQAQLDAAQAAWADLRRPWKRLLAVAVGPIDDDGYEAAVDFWPVRPSSVDGGVAAGVSNQAELDGLGVAPKGMPALEYLLFDPVGGDPAVLAALAPTDAGDRCAYAELLADDLGVRLGELDEAWRGGFAAELRGDASSERFPSVAVALDAVVNALIAGLHDIDDMKLAAPLGLSSGAGPDPSLVESRLADRSLADARDGLSGFADAYLGTGDGGAPGLTVLVASKSPTIDAGVREAITAAEDALAAVPEPLRISVADAPDSVAAAIDAVHELRIRMATDVAGLLGVTVALSDNDGD